LAAELSNLRNEKDRGVNMPLPSIIFGILISTLCGSLVHLILGGNFRRLSLFILFSWAGFWVGHFVAVEMSWSVGDLGPLHLLPAMISSFIFTGIGFWLIPTPQQKKENNQ
jgi:hypothetical protein